MKTDWVTFNGYANQYVDEPDDSRARRDGALLGRRRGANARHRLPRRRHDLRPGLGEPGHDAVPGGVQTVGVPAGGGAVFDVKIDEPGCTRSSPTRSQAWTWARWALEGGAIEGLRRSTRLQEPMDSEIHEAEAHGILRRGRILRGGPADVSGRGRGEARADSGSGPVGACSTSPRGRAS